MTYIFDYVEKQLKNDNSGHGFDHIMRVYNNAIYLSEFYDVDLDVIKMAALLHDCIDEKIVEDPDLELKNIEKLLMDNNVSHQKYLAVVDIICNMSYREQKINYFINNIEGQIVQDADRLDAIGAVGIARTFSYGASKNRPMYGNELATINHFEEKLFNLYELFNTKHAKQIAKKRTEFMHEFVQQFNLEVGLDEY